MTTVTMIDSGAKIHEWFGGMRLYTWRRGFVAFKGAEAIVFAEGLGYREGVDPEGRPSGSAERAALQSALGKYSIEHTNASQDEIDALSEIKAAITLLNSEDYTSAIYPEIPAFALPDAQSVRS